MIFLQWEKSLHFTVFENPDEILSLVFVFYVNFFWNCMVKLECLPELHHVADVP